MRLPALLLTAVLSGPTGFGLLELRPVLEPGQQVVFGGRQSGGFLLKLRNSGHVPVLVAERLASGERRERGRFAPHQRASLHFAAHSAAVIRGLVRQPAKCDVKLSSQAVDGLSVQ